MIWAAIITIKRTKDLNYFSLCALNLFNTQVSQFELNYWNKWTFLRHSNLLRCTCITNEIVSLNSTDRQSLVLVSKGWIKVIVQYKAVWNEILACVNPTLPSFLLGSPWIIHCTDCAGSFFPLYPLPFFCFSHEICRFGGGSDLSSADVSHSSRTQLITAFKINKLRPSCSSAEAAASLQVLLRDQIKPQKCISNTPAH